MIHPVTNRPEPKRRFLPSLWERKKIVKLVRGIKSGKIKPIKKPEKPRLYMLWNDQEVRTLSFPSSILALSFRLKSYDLINIFQLPKSDYQDMESRIILHLNIYQQRKKWVWLIISN